MGPLEALKRGIVQAALVLHPHGLQVRDDRRGLPRQLLVKANRGPPEVAVDLPVEDGEPGPRAGLRELRAGDGVAGGELAQQARGERHSGQGVVQGHALADDAPGPLDAPGPRDRSAADVERASDLEQLRSRQVRLEHQVAVLRVDREAPPDQAGTGLEVSDADPRKPNLFGLGLHTEQLMLGPRSRLPDLQPRDPAGVGDDGLFRVSRWGNDGAIRIQSGRRRHGRRPVAQPARGTPQGDRTGALGAALPAAGDAEGVPFTIEWTEVVRLDRQEGPLRRVLQHPPSELPGASLLVEESIPGPDPDLAPEGEQRLGIQPQVHPIAGEEGAPRVVAEVEGREEREVGEQRSSPCVRQLDLDRIVAEDLRPGPPSDREAPERRHGKHEVREHGR